MAGLLFFAGPAQLQVIVFAAVWYRNFNTYWKKGIMMMDIMMLNIFSILFTLKKVQQKKKRKRSKRMKTNSRVVLRPPAR